MDPILDIVLWSMAALAVLPMLLFWKKFHYWRAPKEIFSDYKKLNIFQVQMLIAAVLGIITFVLLRDYSAAYAAWFEREGVILVPTIGICVPIYSFLVAQLVERYLSATVPAYKQWRLESTNPPTEDPFSDDPQAQDHREGDL